MTTITKELFTIPRRYPWLAEIKVEIECDPTAGQPIKLGLAIRAAVKSGADLSGAYLSGADLSGADLSGAYLSGADLSGAYLSGADLSRANLSGADLSGADLSGADLSGAYLSGADLSGTYLSGADLSGADLSGADLSGADLSRANLSGADLSEEALRPFKADLWATILSLRAIPVEMRHLIAKLRAGQVDGDTYGDPSTECACLVGTLAQPRGVSGQSLDHSSARPAERWFMMISPGDEPGKVGDDGKETGGGFAARKALEWTLDLAAILGIEVDAKADAESA
jgi:hypothetical protein